ncbi:MAG: enoyl-CoA hydratase/isomerase family protein [Pararhodobacter sp.]|nr:enoyl-CoA hydratase/isomerase family protein [Pararhodobacter sp.]
MKLQRIELGAGPENRLTAAGMRALLAQVGAALNAGRGLHIVPAQPGRFFCSGFDLDDLAGRPRDEARAAFADFLQLGRLVFITTRPVIAETRGHAVGVGAMLVMAADTAIMTPRAKLRFPEITVGLGLFDDTVAMIRHRVSGSMSERLVLHGEALSAQECLSLGLAQLVADEPLSDSVLEQWRTNAPDAESRALIKRLCRAGVLSGGIDAQLDAFMESWDRFLLRRRQSQGEKG